MVDHLLPCLIHLIDSLRAGGVNNQSLPGMEANLDVQFAFGISYPVRVSDKVTLFILSESCLQSTFYSTAGRAEFNPDALTQLNTNE